MSDTPLNERLNQLCKWLDEMANSCEDISYHYQAEDIRELLSAIDDLKRQLAERRKVTYEPTEAAIQDIAFCLQSRGLTLSRELSREIWYAAHGVEKTALEAGEDG